jgi:NADPH-dependent 2,4-dienoyl-CoA reductase/sulfur reductase-like enzyme
MPVSEYAGEIRHYYPDKKVTVVHGGKELVNKTYPTKFRRSILDATEKLGVQVVLGDKLSPQAVPEGGYVTTERGQRIRADIVVVAAGGRPNSKSTTLR